ncbi:MAG: HAD family phosphatase [Verrucomicrobia bacterium]|nr:HAD family phosphatase [Verrucomicrobiota bacterium]
MTLPIQLISTDFDGTFFAEFESPPVPEKIQTLIGQLQAQGAKWVINTGRDMSSLMEALGRARVSVHPDYLVLVEREIYCREGSRYVSLEEWNQACVRDHEALFTRVRADLPTLMEWVNSRYEATVYEDPYSPFCLIAGNHGDADAIHDYLSDYCCRVPALTVVRNDVYARFSHAAYNKGKALAEIARRLRIGVENVFAAGDHLNDLPMLSREFARWLVAPENAVDAVKESVRRQNGFVSLLPHAHGVAQGLELHLADAGALISKLIRSPS